jgi:nicotinamide-nucleotide amidase
VRITVKAANREEADQMIAPLEQEVRGLLGEHVFAVDNQTMQDVVGGLLRSRGLTVASYEGITGGLLAQQLQEASGEYFLQGAIGRQQSVLRHLLGHSETIVSYDDLVQDGAGLADELAAAVRIQAGAELGVAVHSLPELEGATENLSAGRTYISVASKVSIARREYNFAGFGLPDRTRATLHALDLLRTTILRAT